MRSIIKLFAAGAAILLMATGASAAIVCNEDGDCWKTKKRYDYRPEFRLRVYEDDWKWKDAEKDKYRWRESRDGPGYWRNGVWIEF